MALRFAMLALALRCCGAARRPRQPPPQAAARRPTGRGPHRHRSRRHRGRERPRGQRARQRRDPARRHDDLRRDAALQPRDRARRGRRRRAPAARRRPLLRPAPALQHARRHRRVREPELSPRARPHRARQRRAHRVPRPRPLPPDQRQLHHLPARDRRTGGLEAREIELDFEEEEGTASGPRLRFFDTTILASPVGGVPARRPAPQRPAHAVLRADQLARLRGRHSVLLEHRARSTTPRSRRCSWRKRGAAAEEPGPLPAAVLHRRAQVRVPARRHASSATSREGVSWQHTHNLPAQHHRRRSTTTGCPTTATSPTSRAR